jgi:hypothetical protein
MSGSYYTLDAKYNSLLALINQNQSVGNTLEAVLTAGNDAGGLSMTNINNVDLVTINGSVYPPAVAGDDLEQVLTNGNDANGLSMTNLNDVGLTTINGAAYPPVTPKAFVYLASLPAGYATKIYSTGSVVFGGLVAPFLSVKSTAGLTNSGTNGWVRTATLGAEGRFYSPTTTQWGVNIVSNYTALYNSLIIARIYNSAGVLQSGRYVSSNEPGSNDAFTFNAEMNAGDYLQFQTDAPVSNPGLQLQYDNELYTSLQIREL